MLTVCVEVTVNYPSLKAWAFENAALTTRGQSRSVSSLLDRVCLKVKAHKLSQLVVVDNRILRLPRPNVVFQSAGCLPSLLSVSRGEDIVSGLTFGGDSPNRRSSTPSLRIGASAGECQRENIYSRKGGLTCQTAAGRFIPAPNSRRKKLAKATKSRCLGFLSLIDD